MQSEVIRPEVLELYEAVKGRAQEGELRVRRLEADELLFRQGDRATTMWIVIGGRLVAQHGQGAGAVRLSEMGPGQLVGEIGALAGAVRTATVAALEPTDLLEIPATTLATVAAEHPQLIEALDEVIHTRVRRSLLAVVLPRLFGELDDGLVRRVEAAVTWTNLRAGQALYEEGSSDDSLYLVVSGRLRAERVVDGETRVLAEMGRGDVFGEIALLTGRRRAATMRAVRDAEVARLDKAAFEVIAAERPQVWASLSRVVVEWLTQEGQPQEAADRTFAVVAITPSASVSAFVDALCGALNSYGKAQSVSRASVAEALGSADLVDVPPGRPQHTVLELWLEEWERRADWTLHQADPGDTEWTRRCVRQADRVILLAEASEEPEPWVEALLARFGAASTDRVLVLSHSAEGRIAGTARWLDAIEVTDHYHLRRGHEGDVSRVARCLTGNAIGLVLGGGGARGFAHIGVVRAMRELGLPIDRVAGTSMGAIVGALVAADATHEELMALARDTFIRDRVQNEYTLPIVSLNKSVGLDRAARRAYEPYDIEDLPLPFFCVSCDLTAAATVVHRRGPLWKAARASSSLPGIFVPVVHDQHLLVDGGIVDNLPGLAMRPDCGRVIVVDVSPAVDLAWEEETIPSPWAVVRSRLNPLGESLEVPGILAVLTRAAMVASSRMSRAARDDADLVLAPPIDDFGLLEFERYEEIEAVGYAYGMEVLPEAISRLLPGS